MTEDREQTSGEDRDQNVGDVEGHSLRGQNIGQNVGTTEQNIGQNVGTPTDQNVG